MTTTAWDLEATLSTMEKGGREEEEGEGETVWAEDKDEIPEKERENKG